MKKLLYIPFFFVFLSFTLHKFYVSVTEISIKKDKLEIIMRVFPDDMENVLKDTYHISPDLSKKETLKYVDFYLKQKFKLRINKQETDYKIVGSLLEDGYYVILIEVPLQEQVKSIEVENRILQDLFDAQKNIVHFIQGNKKESFILTKANPVTVYP